MKPSVALATEFSIGVAFMSWNALKQHFWPWPGNIARIGVGFAIIGILAVPAPELAVTLGAGYLLVDIIKMLSTPHSNLGLPPTVTQKQGPTFPGENLGTGNSGGPYGSSYLTFGSATGYTAGPVTSSSGVLTPTTGAQPSTNPVASSPGTVQSL